MQLKRCTLTPTVNQTTAQPPILFMIITRTLPRSILSHWTKPQHLLRSPQVTTHLLCPHFVAYFPIFVTECPVLSPTRSLTSTIWPRLKCVDGYNFSYRPSLEVEFQWRIVGSPMLENYIVVTWMQSSIKGLHPKRSDEDLATVLLLICVMESVFMEEIVGYLALSTRSSVGTARSTMSGIQATTLRVGLLGIVSMPVVFSTSCRTSKVRLAPTTSSSTSAYHILMGHPTARPLGVRMLGV